jgi:hypothetical protein
MAREAAELLVLAEHAAERPATSRTAAPGRRQMRALADACFDVILQIDAARQDLVASYEADPASQCRSRQHALRCAQTALAELERRLAQVLAD